MFLYNHMAVFSAIATEGSITAASHKLELPKSTVSLKLKELEEELGVQLIQRTTRTLTLTEHGRHFFERCQEMFELGDAATRQMQGVQQEPIGTLKFTCPFGFSDGRMSRTIVLFSQRCPKVKLQILSSNERVDIVREGIDVALRLGVLEDSSLIARRVTACRRWPLASPAYIKAHGAPQKPQDLLKHRCIVSSFTPRWSFLEGKKVHAVDPVPHMRVTDVVMARELAIAGTGICMLPDILLTTEIENGELVPLLPAFPMETRDLNLLYPRRQLQSPAVKRFVETTLEVFQNK